MCGRMWHRIPTDDARRSTSGRRGTRLCGEPADPQADRGGIRLDQVKTVAGLRQIVEADLWDRDYLDLVEPAYLQIGNDGPAEFAFGAVNATAEPNMAVASSSS